MIPFLIVAILALVLWLVRVTTRLGELDESLRRLRQEIADLRRLRTTESIAPTAAPAKPEIRSTPMEMKPTVPQPVPEARAEEPQAPAVPPIIQQSPRPPFTHSIERRPPAPTINWEQFMGVKGFAWIGGLALFLGIAFFVKYSFDNNLISPELRVTLGFIAGLVLVVGGAKFAGGRYAVLSQTLSATGIVVLYAVTFACRSVYHFAFFAQAPTFILMALITAAAFVLAVRQNALVVAILGMLAGFLTPGLLSTGEDNPLGLFGYIALLDVGLILVAMNRRWDFLTTAAALGTALMQVGWVAQFFTTERYFEGNKILVPLAVLGGFNALFLLANWIADRRKQMTWWLTASNFGLAGLALAFTAFFLSFPSLSDRPALFFTFVFVIDLMITALVYLKPDADPVQPVAGVAVFILLAAWSAQSLRSELLNTALIFYFVFALFHTLFPVLISRFRISAGIPRGSQLFPPLSILLVFAPILKLTDLSLLVWPFVFVVDLLAIAMAAWTRKLLPMLAVLLLTMAATAALILMIPSDLSGLSTALVLIGVFAVFFSAGTPWLLAKIDPGLSQGLGMGNEVGSPESLAATLPLISVVLPFFLLMMATLRLQLMNPASIFSTALLLVILLLGITRIFKLDALPVIGLMSLFALEWIWSLRDLRVGDPTQLLVWYVAFNLAFAAFPFVFLSKFTKATAVWAAAALAGPAQFFLIYRLVKTNWPDFTMGLLPAMFAVPALASLFVLVRKMPPDSKARLTQLAWFGGMALFFITLIFPIQFKREWVTIGWALEGVALAWLFHRVPHPGLRLTGVGLLGAAFARLVFNPAVLSYHPRSATPILNWYLYTYGIVSAAFFMGARLLAPPRDRALGMNVRALLAALGTILSFVLLNIEIADYFSPPDSTLTFQFSGNFARDMTYSIAWALFALGLLVYGIWKGVPTIRYASMGLLSVTLAKLFFHDLASLAQPYRIVAFISVAVVAMLASFAYQRFFSSAKFIPVGQSSRERGGAQKPQSG